MDNKPSFLRILVKCLSVAIVDLNELKPVLSKRCNKRRDKLNILSIKKKSLTQEMTVLGVKSCPFSQKSIYCLITTKTGRNSVMLALQVEL